MLICENSPPKRTDRDRPSWIGGVARSAGVVVQDPNRELRFIGDRTTTPSAASPQPSLLSRRGNVSTLQIHDITAAQIPHLPSCSSPPPSLPALLCTPSVS